MAIPKKGYTKASIGGPETNKGVAVARTARLPITAMAYVQETPTKTPNEIITGRNSTNGYSVDAIEYACELSTAMGANKAFAMLLDSCLGRSSASVQVGAGIGVAYIGEAKSCKLVVTASDIKAYAGAYGKEILDTSFGTNGTLALTGTVEALVSTINGCPSYNAYVLAGSGSATASAAVPVATAQAKNHGVPIWFSSPDSGVYLHSFKPNNTNTENPTYTVQFDGVGRNEVGPGAMVNSATFSGDLKAKMAATWSLVLLGLENAVAETTTQMGDAEMESMKFSEGSTYIEGKRLCYIKNISLTVSNNVSSDDGWCQGSLKKKEHVRGAFAVTGSATLTLTDETQEQVDAVMSNAVTSLQAVHTGRILSGSLKSMVMFDISTMQYTSYSKSAGDATVDLSLELEAVDGMAYDDFFQVQMLSDFQ